MKKWSKRAGTPFCFTTFLLFILLIELAGKAAFLENKYQTVSIRMLYEMVLPDHKSSSGQAGLPKGEGSEGSSEGMQGGQSPNSNEGEMSGGSGNQDRAEKSGISAEELIRAMEQEYKEKEENCRIREVTAYTKLGTATLNEPKLDTTVRAGCYLVYGNMERVLPVSLLEGSFCFGEDPTGCVIDKNTAYQLYGTRNAKGNLLTYQDIRYEIRGVADTEIPFFMIQGDGKSEIYDNMEFLVENGEMAGETVKEFLSAYHLGDPGEYVCIEGSFLSEWIGRITMLPLWLFLAVLLIGILRREADRVSFAVARGRNRESAITKKEVLRWLSLLSVLAISCILVKAGLKTGILRNPLYLPLRFLPTRFSDLSFWGDQWREGMEWYQNVLYLSPYPKEIILLQTLRSWLAGSAMAYLLLFTCLYFVFSQRYYKGRDKEPLDIKQFQ